MTKTLIKMIKNGVMLGLHNAKYNIDKAFPGDVLGSMLFYKPHEHDRAFSISAGILSVMKKKKNELPSDRKELKKYVNVKIAERSFQDALSLIGCIFADRTNKQLLEECEFALKTIEKDGIKYSTSYEIYKRQLEILKRKRS